MPHPFCVLYVVAYYDVSGWGIRDKSGTYRISSKSRRTSKSRRPRNVAASICHLVPINATLEISPHGKGSIEISVCAGTFYVHTTRLIIEAVYVAWVSISVDAALEI